MNMMPKALLLTALATLAALPAQSQERPRREHMERGRQSQVEQLLRIRQRLELSEDQVARLRELQEQAREEFRTQMETFRSEAEERSEARRSTVNELLTETQREQLQELRERGPREGQLRAQIGQRHGNGQAGRFRGRSGRQGVRGQGVERLRQQTMNRFRQRRPARVRRFRHRGII